ncbi:DegT/DnrJ/EryC1/StrS family aminotransferase [Brachybacterium sp. Marseille-Q7125]|uniref:DegT/DnrJ/EryC1/StrS family aminotransferase n=1 Tax=Brachybacterium sp. Marseille-Q7125 TaxID=2932815 RepID=UPI001FF6F394|nr:DegT/DnrJ/EryC1/StrS family aminotransferase [Brachybacterium sp. Marseille-Q7125]
MTDLPFLPFAKPDITDAEVNAAADAIRSGWLTTGPSAKAFEQEFAEFLGSDLTAIAINSATAGLHLALESLGIGPGDEVLVPTWTFTSTAEVVRYLGATPILVDVDPVTLNIDYESAAAKVSSRTRAVMPVHIAGLMVSPEATREFAARHGLAVVEDAAHALPARAGGEVVGTGASHATVFSFYATKTITTGEGGMVVTRDQAAADRMRTMRLHGISRDVFNRYSSRTPAWQYEVVAPGFKYNLSDPAAAIGRVQLGRAVAMRDARAEIARRYTEAFADLGLTLPADAAEGDLHSWHLYMIRVPDGLDRDDVVQRLADLGIGTSVHFIPLHLHPYWQDLGGHRPEDFPVATREFGRVISLPAFSAMTDAEVERIIEAVRIVCR